MTVGVVGAASDGVEKRRKCEAEGRLGRGFPLVLVYSLRRTCMHKKVLENCHFLFCFCSNTIDLN